MTRLSRRTFVQALCAAGVATPLAGACQNMQGGAMASGPFFQAKSLPIGIQLYSLGDMPRTDLDGTLKQLASTGYKSVELAGYYGKTPAELRKSFDAAGIACTSAHVAIREASATEPGLLGDLGKLAADMHTVGATHVVAPVMAKPDDLVLPPAPDGTPHILARIASAMSADQWKRQAAQLNNIGRTLKGHGIGFGYHNHNMEFTPVGGTTGFDILLAETDPSLVTFELDVGWVAAGGRDPAEVFAAHPGRFGLMHVKDVKASTQANTILKMDPTEVGSGRLDWAKIIPAAYKAGVR